MSEYLSVKMLTSDSHINCILLTAVVVLILEHSYLWLTKCVTGVQQDRALCRKKFKKKVMIIVQFYNCYLEKTKKGSYSSNVSVFIPLTFEPTLSKYISCVTGGHLIAIFSKYFMSIRTKWQRCETMRAWYMEPTQNL